MAAQDARIWGLVIGLLSVAVLHLLATRNAANGRAETVNTHNYGRIKRRASSIGVRLSLCPGAVSCTDVACRTAYCEALAAHKHLRQELEKPGVAWSLRTGYTGAWDLIYWAEEALLECECCSSGASVIAEARYDIARVKNSGMDDEAALLNQLRVAIIELDPGADVYLDLLPTRLGNQPHASATSEGNTSKSSLSSSGDTCKHSPRAMVREVLHSLNEFRQTQYEGMLRARNVLLQAIFWTGLAAYLLVLIGVLVGVSYQSLATAMGLAVLGALLGAFGRLYRQTKVKAQVDDLGLTGAQVIANLVYSAIAAVVGIVLIVILYHASVFTALVTSSSPAATPMARSTGAPSIAFANPPFMLEAQFSRDEVSGNATSTNNTFPSIDEIFNLDDTPLAPVIAAIFGLVPSLLVTTLQQQATRFQTNILKTEASGSGDI